MKTLAKCLCLALALWLAVFAAANRPALAQSAAEPLRIVAGPYLQNASATTMTIMWMTNRNSTGAVECGPPGGELKTVVNSHDGLKDTNERVHKVVVTGLKPGAVYRYRALSRDILRFAPYKVDFGETVDTGFQEFRAFDPARQDFSFVVLNDIHDTPATIPEMLKTAGEKSFDFVVLNGDTVSDIDKEEQIRAILSEAASTFASRLPLFWVRGNHETRGQLARSFSRYVDSPNGHYYYSFDHGPVHFIVLDTGEDKMDSQPAYSGQVDFTSYRRQEAEWLKAEVRSAAFRRAKYHVVFAHMPFPAASRRAAQNPPDGQPDPFTGMADDFASFGGTLERAGIDMMISGHTHRAAIIEAEAGRHSYPIVQGGGPRGPGRTVIRVNVTAKQLEATVLRPDGSVFGTARVSAKSRARLATRQASSGRFKAQ